MQPKTKTLPIEQPTPKQLQKWKESSKRLVRECSESQNQYLLKFAASPLAELFRTEDKVMECFGRTNRSALRKELMEAAALEARLQRTFPSDDGEHLLIFDLCCGKGFSAAWLSVNTYPKATIHLVDRASHTNRDYLSVFPKLTYHNLDLYSTELEDLIRNTVDSNPDARVILVGIHLCGDLSRRALELQSSCGAAAAILSPCCTMRQVKPKKRRPEHIGYNVPQVAKQLKVVSPYELWCWFLWGYARCAPISSTSLINSNSNNNNNSRRRLDLGADHLMRTDKNIWLVVIDEKLQGET